MPYEPDREALQEDEWFNQPMTGCQRRSPSPLGPPLPNPLPSARVFNLRPTAGQDKFVQPNKKKEVIKQQQQREPIELNLPDVPKDNPRSVFSVTTKSVDEYYEELRRQFGRHQKKQ